MVLNPADMPKRLPAPPIIAFQPNTKLAIKLEVVRLGDTLPQLGLHGHQFFELLLFEAGTGFHQQGGRSVAIAAGDLFLLAPGETHELVALRGVAGWLLVFELDALGLEGVWANLPQQLLLLSFLRPQGLAAGHFRLAGAELAAWSARLAQVAEELAERPLGFAEAAQAHLRLLLIAAARLASGHLSGIAPSQRPLLAEVFGFIERHAHQPISLAAVAAHVGRSSAHLTDLVRRETGRSVLAWIIERRLSLARQQLLTTEATIEQIAELLGYSDPAYFVRQFKQHHQQTPQAWRRANRGQ
jgi:AraC-like DNA-binding protein